MVAMNEFQENLRTTNNLNEITSPIIKYSYIFWKRNFKIFAKHILFDILIFGFKNNIK